MLKNVCWMANERHSLLLLAIAAELLSEFAASSSLRLDAYQILMDSSEIDFRSPLKQVIWPFTSLRIENVSLDLAADLQIRVVAWDPLEAWAGSRIWRPKRWFPTDMLGGVGEELLPWKGETLAWPGNKPEPQGTKHGGGWTPSVMLTTAGQGSDA